MKVSIAGSAELTFLLGADDRPDTVDNVDIVLDLYDGTSWSGTVLSLREIGRVMDRWRQTGESLAGRYFACPDLVIVREGGVANIAEVITDLLRNGGPTGVLKRVSGPSGHAFPDRPAMP